MGTRNRRVLILLVVAAILAAALAVRHFRRQSAIVLEKALSGEPDQRVAAIRQIADAGLRAYSEALVTLIQDPDPRMAAEACLALGQMRAQDRLPPLRATAAADARVEVREAAVVAIGRMGEKSSGQFLLERLQGDPTPEVKVASADALGRLRTVEAMPALFDLLDSPSENVRRSANQAITNIWMIDHGFKANDPPDKRRELVKGMRAAWDWYVKGPAYPYLKAKAEKQP